MLSPLESQTIPMGSYRDRQCQQLNLKMLLSYLLNHLSSRNFFTAPLMFTKMQDQLTGPSRSVLAFQSDSKRWGEAQQLLDDELQVSHGNLLALLSQRHLQVNPKRPQTVTHTPNHKDLKFKLPFLTPALPWDSCATASLSAHHSSVQDFLFQLFKPWSRFQLLLRGRQCQSDSCYSQRKSWSTSHLSDLRKVLHKIHPALISHPFRHQYSSEHRFH